jgi:large subunit ribosomal protein L24e
LPRIYQCDFCRYDIPPGTGRVFVKNDGTIFRFCSNKCFKNMFVLKRKPRKLKWTKVYEPKLPKPEKTENKEA